MDFGWICKKPQHLAKVEILCQIFNVGWNVWFSMLGSSLVFNRLDNVRYSTMVNPIHINFVTDVWLHKRDNIIFE